MFYGPPPLPVASRSRLSANTVRLVLNSRWQKARFVLILVLPTTLFTLKAAQIALASIYERSQSISGLERSIALDRTNPEAYHQFGQTILYQLESSQQEQGLADLRKAVALGPDRAYYWLDLALACASAANDRCAEAGFDRALRLSPSRPRIHWLAANYELGNGQMEQALGNLRSTLNLGSNYDMAVFELCSRAHIDPETVDSRVLPMDRDPALRLQYAGFLVKQHQVSGAVGLWQRAVAERHPFPFSSAEPYIDELIAQKEYVQAFAAWRDLEALGAVGASMQPETDSVFNGGFEEDPLNAGFDWRYGQPSYLILNFADSQAYKGRRSLRLDFEAGHNEDFEPTYEIVPVKPSRPYLLTAFIRSEGITSDSGPRLHVVDATDPHNLNVAGESTAGTTAWHSVQLRFVTGPRTEAIQISIWRPKSRTFPGLISGSVWIDDVSLRAVPPRSS